MTLPFCTWYLPAFSILGLFSRLLWQRNHSKNETTAEEHILYGKADEQGRLQQGVMRLRHMHDQGDANALTIKYAMSKTAYNLTSKRQRVALLFGRSKDTDFLFSWRAVRPGSFLFTFPLREIPTMFPTSQLSIRLPLALSFLAFISSSQGCSTASLPPIYNAYSDCAAQCLACPDSDYVNNFAHNCNYTNGDCCRSKYHTVIAASWDCVWDSCNGMKLAQESFDAFVEHCKNVGVPLAGVDVPQGYNLNDTGTGGGNNGGNGTGSSEGSPATDDAKKGSSSHLATGTIVGIVTGSVVAAAGIVGAIFKCLSYRHRKKHGATNNNNNQLVPWQPAWQGMPAGALTGDADGRAKYTRKQTSFAGLHRTTETFEIARQPTPPAAAVLGRGRILGEV
ncbi:hypothetical protein H2200_011212 [Cladophialophora chaetospira]|uniref:Extracellular membrane protein CFEM domain-containing protein n=1 Tax=Cladophialophora chaetospira TaxID=386627 RepID=A0AA38X095_9EURO|nr:hypothetical protein H2200_011212 [Cladophialophora chaetospira]